MNKNMSRRQSGFSLIEMMIALAIALFLLATAVGVYVSESNVYKTTGAQASIQSAENALSVLLTSTIRSAGFLGCSNLSNGNYGVNNSLVGITASFPPPIGGSGGSLGTFGSGVGITGAGGYAPKAQNSQPPAPTSVVGYDAVGTDNGDSITLSKNADNDKNDADWLPRLDASFINPNHLVQRYSDVLVVLGPVPDSSPVTIAGMPAAGHLALPPATNPSYFPTGQWVAVSTCSSSALFQAVAGGGDTLVIPSGIQNFITSSLGAAAVAPNIQIIPIQQTAFFIGQGTNGQSSLMRSVLGNDGVWVTSPLVPGVDNMQILYGVAAAGSLPTSASAQNVTQYLPASAVAAGQWPLVHSIRLGFLIEGPNASTSTLQNGAPPATFNVLNTIITPPQDTRLRHVFEMTVNLRNST